MGCEKTDEVCEWTGDSSAVSGPVSLVGPALRDVIRREVWCGLPCAGSQGTVWEPACAGLGSVLSAGQSVKAGGAGTVPRRIGSERHRSLTLCLRESAHRALGIRTTVVSPESEYLGRLVYWG